MERWSLAAVGLSPISGVWAGRGDAGHWCHWGGGSVHTQLQRESLFFTMTMCSRQLFTLCSFLDGSAGVWSQGAEIWT